MRVLRDCRSGQPGRCDKRSLQLAAGSFQPATETCLFPLRALGLCIPAHWVRLHALGCSLLLAFTLGKSAQQIRAWPVASQADETGNPHES